VSPSLLFQWRRHICDGGHEAVRADEDVVSLSRVRELELENKIRLLERLLGRKTMETEIPREALDTASRKKSPGSYHRCPREIPGEDRCRHAEYRPFQPRGAAPASRLPATRILCSRGRRRDHRRDPSHHRYEARLWLSTRHGLAEPGQAKLR
jgi:hypothetical protein